MFGRCGQPRPWLAFSAVVVLSAATFRCGILDQKELSFKSVKMLQKELTEDLRLGNYGVEKPLYSAVAAAFSCPARETQYRHPICHAQHCLHDLAHATQSGELQLYYRLPFLLIFGEGIISCLKIGVHLTIADVAISGVQEELIRQAIQEALQRGLTSREELQIRAGSQGGTAKRMFYKVLDGDCKL